MWPHCIERIRTEQQQLKNLYNFNISSNPSCWKLTKLNHMLTETRKQIFFPLVSLSHSVSIDRATCSKFISKNVDLHSIHLFKIHKIALDANSSSYVIYNYSENVTEQQAWKTTTTKMRINTVKKKGGGEGWTT